jgi:hypothetical protein
MNGLIREMDKLKTINSKVGGKFQEIDNKQLDVP